MKDIGREIRVVLPMKFDSPRDGDGAIERRLLECCCVMGHKRKADAASRQWRVDAGEERAT